MEAAAAANDLTLNFGVVDYVIFILMLCLSLVIGIASGVQGKNTTEDFLMGGRRFGPFPVAMSLVTSLVSSVALLGFSGEGYAQGLQPAVYVIGEAFASIVMAHTVINVIYPLQITSINEYFELRFKSSLMRSIMMCIWLFTTTIFLGVWLYTPTLAMSLVMPLDNMSHVYILAVICTVYSAVGGIRAVIWTDVFQLTVVHIGILFTLILGCVEVGGFANAIKIAYEGGRTELFNVNFSIFERHTMWNTFFGGFFFYMVYGITQVNVQRLCSVKSLEDARKTLYLNAIGLLSLFFLVFAAALAAFSVYSDCDPYMAGKIERKEQILPYFIADKGKYIMGLSGLFIATIIGSTLSTVSSSLNSLVSVVYTDILKKLPCMENVSERKAAFIIKGLTVLFGVIGVAMSILARNVSSVITAVLTLTGVSYGPVLGVFLLGICWPKCGVKGAYTGFFVAIAFVAWIAFGAYVYKPPPKFLPMSVDNCTLATHNGYIGLNTSNSSLISMKEMSTLRFRSYEEYETWYYASMENPPALMPLYTISYTLYPIVATVLCFIVGIIVTWLTGSNDLEEVDPSLVLPFLRRFFFSKTAMRGAANNLKRRQKHPNPTKSFSIEGEEELANTDTEVELVNRHVLVIK